MRWEHIEACTLMTAAAPQVDGAEKICFEQQQLGFLRLTTETIALHKNTMTYCCHFWHHHHYHHHNSRHSNF